MTRIEEYEGIFYKIEYIPSLSNHDYTQHYVYHIETVAPLDTIKKVIKTIFNNDSWTEAKYNEMYKQNPSMANALHSYYKLYYDATLGKYVYVQVIPYDD